MEHVVWNTRLKMYMTQIEAVQRFTKRIIGFKDLYYEEDLGG